MGYHKKAKATIRKQHKEEKKTSQEINRLSRDYGETFQRFIGDTVPQDELKKMFDRYEELQMVQKMERLGLTE